MRKRAGAGHTPLCNELLPRRIALEVNRWLLGSALVTRVALLEGPIAHTLVELAWPFSPCLRCKRSSVSRRRIS